MIWHTRKNFFRVILPSAYHLIYIGTTLLYPHGMNMNVMQHSLFSCLILIYQATVIEWERRLVCIFSRNNDGEFCVLRTLLQSHQIKTKPTL